MTPTGRTAAAGAGRLPHWVRLLKLTRRPIREFVRHPFASIRVRLTAWYVVVLLVVLLAFSTILYGAVAISLSRGVDENLAERARQIQSSIEVRNDTFVAAQLAQAQPTMLQSPIFYRVWRLVGRQAGGFIQISSLDRDLGVDPGIIAGAARGQETFVTVSLPDGPDLRVLTVPIYATGQVVGVVEVGQSLAPVQQTLGTLAAVLAVGVPLALAFASISGLFLADRALGPIDRLIQRARQIAFNRDLSQRMGVAHGDDEVGRLAATLDDMIERLEGAFQRQQQFTADASHELRTPLAILRSSADLALSQDRTPEEYREVLASMRQEINRMSKVVNDLLVLSRADAGEAQLEREELSSRDLVEAVVDNARPLADEHGLVLEVGDVADVAFLGDETRLTQLLLNLIDNAIKYTPPGGTVTVRSEAVDGWLLLEVRDTGVGIAPEDQARIFERFYRVDKARSREAGGTGLGLAIVRWIAEAHGGRVGVEATPGGGSTFRVWLPLQG